jgi:hypothetical protein
VTKATLPSLFESTALRYKSLRDAALAKEAKAIWASGPGEPFSLEPYRMELLGIDPGKVIESEAQQKPAKVRLKYLLDEHGRVICRTEYADRDGKQGPWIVQHEFYECSDEAVHRYTFGTALEHAIEGRLHRVTVLHLSGSQVTHAEDLYFKRQEYTRKTFEYEDSHCKAVTMTWPDTGRSRHFVATSTHGRIEIFEVENGQRERIYPEN